MQLRLLLSTVFSVLLVSFLSAQNVFDPNDPQIRYSAGAPLGSAQRPDPSINGLQKWVSTPMAGISTGGGSFDNSSYKAYYLKVGAGQMAFRIKFPKNFSAPGYENTKFPAMVFYHGAGEFACNSNNGYWNNEKQLTHGANFFRGKVDNGQFDGFLIYPQINSGSNCWGQWGGPNVNTYGLIVKMIDSLAKYVRLDLDRIIATGLSAGGTGAWHAASSYPRYFAKTAPSAASAPGATKWDEMIHVPVWLATGGKDTNPTPSSANNSYQNYLSRGGDMRFTLYPNLGHGVWGNHWNEPDFIPFMNNMHKANPLVFFQRYEFCPEDPVDTRIGITAGYHSYEWQKDGVTIAQKLGNGAAQIINGASIISYAAGGNEIRVKSFGTYRVRFKRSAAAAWSEWSPSPAEITPKDVTQTPDIQVTGLNSKVLPSPDGHTTVPLTLPDGFAGYNWYDAATEELVSTNQVFNAPPGVYKAKVIESYGCGTLFSPDFKVINEAGTPKPDAVKRLTGTAISATTIRLDWNQNPNSGTNETGFEIYRGKNKTGPFTLMHITAADVVTWNDDNIENNTTYFYFIRPVNNFGAAANSNIAQVKTMDDVIPPSAPSNLRYRGSNENSVDLSWTASTDNGIIKRYDVYANNTKMYSTTNTSITVFGLNPATNYTFYVKAVDNGNNESNPSNQAVGYTHQQGLNYKYYQGSFDFLPDFNALSPVKTGVIGNISNGNEFRNVADYYAVKWEGYIYIPESGTYTFYTSSDDGSKLYINTPYSFGATALVNNDGLHGTTERSGQITLTRGYHSIVATFFEKTGGDVMEVRWQNTAAGITKELIPGGYFALSPVNNLPELPVAPSGLSVTQVSFNQLKLTWADNSSDETGFEIVRSTSLNGTYVQVNTVGAGVTEYTDSALNSSQTYFYKVRTISNAGHSPYTAAVSATTAAAPPVPGVPTGLSATAISGDVVNLSFTDNSTNETGFEIWRSVNNTSNFILLETLPPASGGVINYSDTGLFANVIYYYRVRAKGLTNFSGYTPTVNAKTLNTKPILTSVTDFNIKRGTSYEVEAVAVDVDGDALEFSYITPIPHYVVPNIISNGIIKFDIQPSGFQQGIGEIQLVVHDGFEGRDTVFISFVISNNAVASFDPIPHFNVTEGQLYSYDIQMQDDQELSGFQFEAIDFPDFVFTENLGNGKVRIHIQPGYDHAGNYDGYLRIDDGYGGITFTKFFVTINERDPNEVIKLNLKYFTGNVVNWNDIQLPDNPPVSSPENNNYFSVSNLTNTRGEGTGINISAISGKFNSTQVGLVTGNNTGVYPDNILRDQMSWGFNLGNNSEDEVQLKVSGLAANKHYNFVFFGNFTCFGCQAGETATTYMIGDQTASVRYINNTTETDTIYQVFADENGEVIITMIGDAGVNNGGVLNALEIIATFDDGSAPVKPINFEGVFIENSGVQLNWSDISFNETSYKVFRSESLNGTYQLLNPGANNMDATDYFDASVQPLTAYYYFIAGENSYGLGEHSDTLLIETGNNKPTITALTDLFVKTSNSASLNFSVDDDPVDNLNVYLLNSPAFVTLVPLGNNNYKIDFNPSNNNIGVYDIVAMVDDGKGGVDSSHMKLYVMDKDTRSVYVNFGEVGYEAPFPWNNMMGSLTTNKQQTNLIDENGNNTGFVLRITGRMPSLSRLGMVSGNNSGPYPDIVFETAAAKLASVATDGQFRFSGLNQNLRYNVSVVTSVNEGTENLIEVSSGSQTVVADARYNSHKLITLNGLTPDNNGYIFVTLKNLGSNVTYANAIVLEEFSPAIQVLAPLHLRAEAVDRNTVKLIWSDRNWNEDAVGGMLLERATDSLFQNNLIVLPLNSNTDNYVDNTVQPNTRYYYRVRSKVGAEYSPYSNVSRVTTLKDLVLVNFNLAVENGPAPWNNLQLSPNFLVTVENLKSDNEHSTGMDLEIVAEFNGENTAGKRVGGIGFAPDDVLASSYWIDNSQEAAMKLKGLNHSKKYRIGFFGSMSNNGWFKGNYTAKYTVNGQTVYLNSWDNYTKIVYINDITPDENGEVLLEFSTSLDAAWGFNGGLFIESYDNYDETPGIALVENGAEALSRIITDEEKLASSVKIYPNPFVDNIQLDFNNTAISNMVDVDVLDLSGRLVHRKSFKNLSAGMNTLNISLSDNKLGSGIYLVTLKVNGKAVNISKLIKTNK